MIRKPARERKMLIILNVLAEKEKYANAEKAKHTKQRI